MKIPVILIKPNPKQPRKSFEPEALQQLAYSMRDHGQVQAITVEERPDGMYWLIAGERRWRAARMNGWTDIEATVMPSMNGHGDHDRLTLALIENIHRQDMNPVEVGRAYQEMHHTGLSDAKIAGIVGKSPSNVQMYRAIAAFEPEISSLYLDGRLPVDAGLVSLMNQLTPEKRVQWIPLWVSRGIRGRDLLQRVKNLVKHGVVRREAFEPTTKPEFTSSSAPSLKFGAQGPVGAELAKAAVRTCELCDFGAKPVPSICQVCPVVVMVGLLSKK